MQSFNNLVVSFMKSKLISLLVLLFVLCSLCNSKPEMVKESGNYPGRCRVDALQELQILLKNNNDKYQFGMLSKAMKKCPIIKDSNRYYLLKRWMQPFLLQQNLQLEEINSDIIKKMIKTIETKLALGTSKEKSRMYHTPPQRLSPINNYMQPILREYLKEQDENGFILSARSKYSSYQHILLSPDDYTQYGAQTPSPFTIQEIPKSIKDYNRSTFLRNVYSTKYKKVNTTKLSPEEKLYRVIEFPIIFQNNTSFHFTFFF